MNRTIIFAAYMDRSPAMYRAQCADVPVIMTEVCAETLTRKLGTNRYQAEPSLVAKTIVEFPVCCLLTLACRLHYSFLFSKMRSTLLFRFVVR